MPTLLFDYGGTLDSAARHWNLVLLDAYRHLAHSSAPELQVVQGQLWREAYVHAERSLEAHPTIAPTDTMLDLLRKKTQLQLQHLVAQGNLQLCPAQIEAYALALAQHCDQQTRHTVQQSRSVLETLRQRGYEMHIVSNFYGNLDTVLHDYKLRHLFGTIVESSTVGVRKPDPHIWQLGIEAAGRPAHECVAIGDSYGKDIAPAASLGSTTIWYEGEAWETKSHDRSLPTHTIHHLSQLLTLLP